jgi:hypothetical protein
MRFAFLLRLNLMMSIAGVVTATLLSAVPSALRRYTRDAVERLVFVGVMRDSTTAGRHWRVVDAALHPVSVEIEDPVTVVGGAW